jgi:hypothetical protein
MLAMCYKSYAIDPCLAVRYPIHHAPDGLKNRRETKAFAIENRAGKWSIATVQIGNNFAHTLRDKSQVKPG